MDYLIICRERESQQLTPKVKRRPPLRRGRVSPELPVPDHIPRPAYVGSSELPEIASEHQIPGSQGIADMRAACELAARVLDSAGKLVRVSLLPEFWFEVSNFLKSYLKIQLFVSYEKE